MDKQEIALLIPIIALSIPVVAIIFGSLVKMAKLKADATRDGLGPRGEARIEALEHDLASLRQELVEAQERLDFTERLLASRSESRE